MKLTELKIGDNIKFRHYFIFLDISGGRVSLFT